LRDQLRAEKFGALILEKEEGENWEEMDLPEDESEDQAEKTVKETFVEEELELDPSESDGRSYEEVEI